MDFDIIYSDVTVIIKSLDANTDSTVPAFIQAASAGVGEALRELKKLSSVQLIEPVMDVELSVGDNFLAVVLKDLTERRRASILDVGIPSYRTTVKALTPLSEMIGYANILRSITQGNASFVMKYHGYKIVGANQLKKLTL